MNDAPPLLSVRELNAWYGESHALHGIDLDVHQGETVTLLGRNGVGKTTALRSIMGIIRKRTGTIHFDGHDMMRIPLHRAAHTGMGFVPEERGIFATLTVDENLNLPPIIAKGGMSASEIYELFPNLKERRNSPGTKLSGGEQQMLAIARILRTGAKLLLLDEPTEGLAPENVHRLADVLLELKHRRLSLMLVQQNIRFACMLADRFYLVDHGQIVDSFHVSELQDRMTILNETLGV